VFVVASARADFDPTAVLFEFDGVRRDSAPSREAREDVAGGTGAGAANRVWPAEISSTLDTTFGTKQGLEDQHVNAGCPLFVLGTVQTLRTRRPGEGGMSADHEHLVPIISPALNTCSGSHHAPDTKAYVVQPIANALTASRSSTQCPNEDTTLVPIALQDVTPREKAQNGRGWNDDGTAYTVDTHATQGVAQPITFSSVQSNQGINADLNVSQTLEAKNPMAVAHSTSAAFKYTMGAKAHGIGYAEEQSPTLDTKADSNAVLTPAMAVRRLTPVECERLQGFPDNYTNIPWRKKDESPDGPRYKALGNSWAVPNVRWIGKRIQEQINAA
jgi:DNA (cytosine-5)-methyltransferase 1